MAHSLARRCGPTLGPFNRFRVDHKHHLFPTETAVVTPGPFSPTSFELQGADGNPLARFGLVICYEGLYPSLHNDWSRCFGWR